MSPLSNLWKVYSHWQRLVWNVRVCHRKREEKKKKKKREREREKE